jgi:AraC-like DNA-binding protein
MLTVQNARPDHRLGPFIRSYVQRESNLKGTELVEPVVARLGAVLEFQFADPYEVPLYGIDKSIQSVPITVIGPITYRRARILIRGHVEALAVLFQPLGFHTLFGVPVSPLTDEGTEGHSVVGPAVSVLNEKLGNAASFQERTRLLDSFFLNRLPRIQSLDPVSLGLQRLISSGRLVAVSEVARKAGISTRHLERMSLQYAGMSPRTMARIARFQRALRLKVDGNPSWTKVAHMTDYHDQMHMIRDFRAFASDTPTRAFEQIEPEHLSRFLL